MVILSILKLLLVICGLAPFLNILQEVLPKAATLEHTYIYAFFLR